MDEKFLEVKNLEPEYIQRLFSHISFEKTGCWNWMGNCNKSGYGRFRYKGPKELVHRLMYCWITRKSLSRKIHRDVPILDHICNNKKCCNPSHLRLTTHRVNVLRSDGPSARQARQTHCKNGHPLPTEKNKQGRRICKICNRQWHRNRHRRIKNIPPEKFKV